MTFTDAHGGSSVCTPTRYGLLTGRYAWRTRLQQGVLDGYVEPLIAADRRTVPGFLQTQGYHTAAIGKWHLGFTLAGGEPAKAKGKEAGAPIGARTADGPLTRGFDEFFGFHHARTIESLFEQDRVTRIVEPVEMLPLLARRARQYLEERARGGRPFFLYLPLNSPHTPIVPSKAWQGRSGLGDYADFVMETDAAIGEVLATLDQTGLAGNTLVIATSDNGCSPAAGIPRLEAAGHFPSAHLRGYKADIWDGGHRVPFFARWPDHIKPGSVSTQLTCHTDLFATAAEILGVPLPPDAGVDSVSLLPALLGRPNPVARTTVVHHSIKGRFAVREGEWKLANCPGSGGWGKPGDPEAKKLGLPERQLYDLRADPGETKNLADQHPEIVARLTQLLERQIAEGRSTPGPRQANDPTKAAK
jgi:arylsulfatase A